MCISRMNHDYGEVRRNAWVAASRNYYYVSVEGRMIWPEQSSQPFLPLVLLLFYLHKSIYRYIAVMLIFMKIIGPRNVLA